MNPRIHPLPRYRARQLLFARHGKPDDYDLISKSLADLMRMSCPSRRSLMQRGPQDRSRINTTEDHELQYWTKELGVSAVDLKRLVQMHGNSAEKIREVVGKK